MEAHLIHRQRVDETFEKGKLIQKSLKIIEKLAESNLADMDGEGITTNDFDSENLQNLIIEARTIVGDRWWKLI